MTRWTWSLFLGAVALGAAPAGAATADKLTGCLDEEAGPRYVLRGDRELRLLAVLQPQGFPVENFAKYLGHKVTLTGVITSQGDNKMMSVRSIKNVANTCSPQTAAAPSKQGAGPAAAQAKRVSGCLDEEPGPQYVLRGDRELKLLYQLEPDGFPVQNFARFLGHKVEVSGSGYLRNEIPVMKVRSIKSLADRCTPAQK